MVKSLWNENSVFFERLASPYPGWMGAEENPKTEDERK